MIGLGNPSRTKREGRALGVLVLAMALATGGLATSGRENVVGAWNPGCVPDKPTNLTAAAGGETVVLAWLAPDDHGSPIIGYHFGIWVTGVLVFWSDGWWIDPRPATGMTLTLQGEADFVIPWGGGVQYSIAAVNDCGAGPASDLSNAITVDSLPGPLPQVTVTAIDPGGGSATTDDGTGPTPANPVVTSVTVPATATGGALSIAETSVSEAPGGFVFLGQDIVITSTAATDAMNPLRIVFRIDPQFVPATVFKDGVAVTSACTTPGIADPSPCVESGTGTGELTILTADASVWNVGIAAYAFEGFFTPVDNRPVTNAAKAGSAIPVRFGLGGDRSLNVFASSYPKSQRVSCDAGAPVDGIEETTRSDNQPLTYSVGTDRYQYTWKTDRAWAGTCRELIVRFRDGTEQRAIFQLR
jgi:hypothetical protein